MNFNLAPLSTRRDIAMLGVIHRAALREGPQQLLIFFPFGFTCQLECSEFAAPQCSQYAP